MDDLQEETHSQDFDRTLYLWVKSVQSFSNSLPPLGLLRSLLHSDEAIIHLSEGLSES